MKIKVPVKRLVARLREIDAETKSVHDKEVKAFEREADSYNDRVVKAVSILAQKLKSGAMTVNQFDAIIAKNCRDTIRDKFGIPQPPVKPQKPSYGGMKIKRLEMTEETHITLDESEFHSLGL